MKPNAELAYLVLDHIDAHPEQWDQGTWLKKGDCGTVGCFAGWAVVLAHLDVEFQESWPGEALAGYDAVNMPTGERLSVSEAACCVLGIESQGLESELDLFDGYNTRAHLGRLVVEIFGPRPQPAPVDHSVCDNGGKQVRCDRCGDQYVCTPARDFYCTPQGDHCCEPCLLKGVGATEMHVIDLNEPAVEMQPPPCADHEQSELACPVCTAQRRAFYAALGREIEVAEIVDHGPVKPPYGTPEREAYDREHGGAS